MPNRITGNARHGGKNRVGVAVNCFNQNQRKVSGTTSVQSAQGLIKAGAARITQSLPEPPSSNPKLSGQDKLEIAKAST